MPESPYAPDWTEAERAEWKRRYAADEPVEMPIYEHPEDTCTHCDLLRKWMREVDDELDSQPTGREDG